MKHGRGGHRHRDGRPQRPVLDLTPAAAETVPAPQAEETASIPDAAAPPESTGAVEGAASASFGSTLSAEAIPARGEPAADVEATGEPSAALPENPGGEASAIAEGSQALESEAARAASDSATASDDELRPTAFAAEPSAAAAPVPERERSPTPTAPAPRRRGGFAAATLGLLFGLLGGAATAAAALWFVGLLPPTGPKYPDQVARLGALEGQVRSLAVRPAPAPDPRTGELATRLGALEGQVRDLAARPATTVPASPGEPAASDPSGAQALEAVRALGARLDRAEAALAERPGQGASAGAAGQPAEGGTALAERVAGLAAEDKSLSDRIADLGRRVDEVATGTQAARDAASRSAGAASATIAGVTDQIGGLGRRLDAVEQTAKGLESAAAKAASKPDPDVDRAARAAAAVTALRASAESGAPFASELEAAKAVLPDAGALAPLEPFAAGGLPRTPALIRELSEELGKLHAKSAPPSSAGILERLDASASKLVRVRPADGAAPSRPGDPLGAVENAAARGDVPGALAAAEKLPPDQRAPLEPWIGKARSQQAATEALNRVARDTLAALRPANPGAPGQ